MFLCQTQTSFNKTCLPKMDVSLLTHVLVPNFSPTVHTEQVEFEFLSPVFNVVLRVTDLTVSNLLRGI